MLYEIVRSEPLLYTVGYHDQSGKWHPIADCDSRDEAIKKIHYLNGGN
jgi:hypothetical protein